MRELEEVYKEIPEQIKNKKYCFYVSSVFDNVPKTFKGFKVILSNVVPKGRVYFAQKDLLK